MTNLVHINSNNICLVHRSMLCLHLSKMELELFFDVLNIFPLSSHEVLPCYVFTRSSQYIMSF